MALAGSVADPAVAALDAETAAHHRADGVVVDGERVDGELVDGELVDEAPRHSRLLPIGLALLAVCLVVRLFVAEPVRTDGNSMEPTLHDGDALVIDTLSYRFTDPAVGDVVVARVPGTGERVVKRVVAVGGDSIGIEDGVLIRNGRPVEERYANQDQMAGYYWGPADVPQGSVFLLGDNRLESVDSRSYGPVPIDRIDGRYRFSLWPF